MNKEINPIIYEKIREQKIEEGFDENEAILYLLSIYYDLSPCLCFRDEITRKVNLTKIVDRDYQTINTNSLSNLVKWNVNLFQAEEIVDVNWEWVDKEYRRIFRDIRIDAGGDKSGCISKMKKFFSQNPEVRKVDILEAANRYILPFKNNVENKKYMQRADYFISKVMDGAKGSRLEQYLEIIKKGVEMNSGKNVRTQVIT